VVAAGVALAPAVRAQDQAAEDRIQQILRTQVQPVLDDLDIILTQGPKYLAKRLPVMQSGGDFGAQMDLVKLGDFSVGLGLLSGVYRDFDDIGRNFQRLPKDLPDPLPIPAAVVTTRMALNDRFEVGASYGFFPHFQTKSNGYDIEGTTTIYGARARHRTVEGHGWVPTLASSAAFTYFTGRMDIGRDPDKVPILNQAINDKVFNGNQVLDPSEAIDLGVFFRGAPIMGWDIYQLTFEERAAWAVGFWHPFGGLGLDFAWGHVDSGIRGLEVDTRATGPGHLIDALKQRNISPTVLGLLPDQNVTIESEKPRSVGARAIAGMEFDLGHPVRLALEAQFDFGSYSAVGGFGIRYAYH
jgi:hypothetical protein